MADITINTTGSVNGTTLRHENFYKFQAGIGGILATAGDNWFRLDLSLDTDNNPATLNASCNWLDGLGIMVTTDTGVLTFLDKDISKAGPECWSVDVIITGALIADGPDSDTMPDAFVMTDQQGNEVAVKPMWVKDSTNVIATFFTTLKDGLNNDIYVHGVLKDTNNDNQPDRLEGSWGTDFIDGPLSLIDTNNDAQPDHWQLIRYDVYSGRVQGDSSGNPAGIYFDRSSGFGEDSFSSYGKVTTDFGGGSGGSSVVMQADGKIVVAGTSYASDNISGDDFALARYNTDGSLDTTFSGDGKVTTDFGGDDGGNSVVMQADGKILVVGSTYNGSSSDIALARYNTDGTLDTNFSDDGKATTNFGSGHCVVMQGDGKILVAGSESNDSGNDFALARYNSDGSLDTTFSGDGKVTTDFGGNDGGYSVVMQADGKILVSGATFVNYSSYDFALARYNSDGSLDTTFSGDGKVTTDFGEGDDHGYSVVMQPDGKIIVAGFVFNYSGDFVLARYNADGTLDTTFSDDGKVVTDFGGDDYGFSVVMQPDGKIIVAGLRSFDFAVARYNSDGTLDTTFSGDGKVTTDFGGYDGGYSVVIQADGKIVVAGSSGFSNFISSADFALARFNSDGSLDTISDITPPTVLIFTPIDGATAVAAGSNIELSFSEAIQKGTGLIEIHSGSFTGSVVESYDVATSTNLTVSGSTLTINPTTDLSHNTHYFVTFASSSVKDLSGNSYSGSNTYDFTTVTTTSLLDIAVNTKYWNNDTPIKGVVLETDVQTGDTGSVMLRGHSAGLTTLTPALTAGTAAKGTVDLLDAIAILKSIVGLTTLNGYQQIAADFDKTNGVDLNDAIGILKHVVGLTAPTPEWAFVEKTDLLPDPGHSISVNVTADTTVDLVGILRGDVDGSWCVAQYA